MKDWQAALDQIKTRGCWGIKDCNRKDHKSTGNPKRMRHTEVCLGGVRMRCSEIHKSELAKEIKFKHSSRAECEWTFQDWRAAMDEIKKRGCWGMGMRMSRDAGNRVCLGVVRTVRVGGLRMRCSEVHKSELEQEIHLKRSSRDECEWTMKDWQVAIDDIKKRGCWGNKYRNTTGAYGGRCVISGGVRIGCSKIDKSELEKEVKLKRSGRFECE
jgi:hypothetical protein